MPRREFITALSLATALYALPAQAVEHQVAGYRSNYAITRHADGSATLARLRDATSGKLAPAVGLVKFMDQYVSFDTQGIPGQAYRLYQAAFDREPDLEGLGFWIMAMESGAKLVEVAEQFYLSPEFQARYGAVSDLQFLTLLYKNVLKRTPDIEGQNFWLKNLQGGLPRATVLHDFSESTENKANVAAAIGNGIAFTPFGGSDYAPALQTYQPAVTPAAGSAPHASVTATTVAHIIGTYKRLPVQDGFHSGVISVMPDGKLLWTNDSKVAWTLTPDMAHGVLLTDETNPYQRVGQKDFTLAYVNGKIAGFYFMGEFYARDGIPLPDGVAPNLGRVAQDKNGLHGYLAHRVPEAPAGYDFGFSMYTAMWPLVEKPLADYQAGLGTWIIPNNLSYQEALLPPDNQMRRDTPNSGPNWAYLFQTVEGGMGNWVSTQFPLSDPKFAIVGTTDGYAHLAGSPGWGFNPEALPREWMSIAQLSNKILTPPDGFTFRSGTRGEFFGYAWMALPLTDARAGTVPVGNRSWTLFFNATNFSGPVVFWVPDAWTTLSRTWANARGRGLDAQAARADSSAIEFGSTPSFHNGDSGGNLWLRTPRITFPVDGGDTTYLLADRANYSSNALFAPMQKWFAGGSAVNGTFDRGAAWHVSMDSPSWEMSYNGLPVAGMDKYVSPIVRPTPGGGSAFGLKWTQLANAGVMPEYFQQVGKTLVPVDASAVPAETVLGDAEFAVVSDRGKPYIAPSSWQTPAPAAGPFQATLSDGSVVTYYWYRFIDQPSVQAYGWTEAERSRLQARVEAIHRNWAATREFMPPPTSGLLATLDAALFVKPPQGLEIGYVPIVTAQAAAQ
jgi:hypothetical protein